jgi:phasin
MTEATHTGKPAAVVPLFEMPKFEMPKFEIPKFDMPSMQVPTAFREFAEKGVAQTKQNYEKMKAAAEEATELLETAYSTASKGTTDYGLKAIEIARANTNAYLDYVEGLFGVKSLSELVEKSTAHARSQFEALSAQTKELAALAQKVATETSEPIKTGVEKAMKKVA